MSGEQTKAELKLSKGGFGPLPDQYLSSVMDVRMSKNPSPNFAKRNIGTPDFIIEGKRIEYRRPSFSQGHGRRILFASYFSIESVLLLLCLTASLLLLPLILPPLPPPPLMLLLIPICILALLMILAFMPSSNSNRDVTTFNNKYV